MTKSTKWAYLALYASSTDTPWQRTICLLLDCEGGAYNLAVNDVLLNVEKDEVTNTTSEHHP